MFRRRCICPRLPAVCAVPGRCLLGREARRGGTERGLTSLGYACRLVDKSYKPRATRQTSGSVAYPRPHAASACARSTTHQLVAGDKQHTPCCVRMPRHKAASKALKPTSHSPKPARVFFYYSSDSEAGDDDKKDHKSDNSEEYDEVDEHADYDLPPVLHKPPVSGAGLQFAVDEDVLTIENERFSRTISSLNTMSLGNTPGSHNDTDTPPRPRASSGTMKRDSPSSVDPNSGSLVLRACKLPRQSSASGLTEQLKAQNKANGGHSNSNTVPPPPTTPMTPQVMCLPSKSRDAQLEPSSGQPIRQNCTGFPASCPCLACEFEREVDQLLINSRNNSHDSQWKDMLQQATMHRPNNGHISPDGQCVFPSSTQPTQVTSCLSPPANQPHHQLEPKNHEPTTR